MLDFNVGIGGTGRVLRGLPVHALRGEHPGGAGQGRMGVPALPRPVQLQLPPHPQRLGAHRHPLPPRHRRGCVNREPAYFERSTGPKGQLDF